MSAPEIDLEAIRDRAMAADPLESAKNCAANIYALAELESADPLQAHVARAGKQAADAAMFGQALALVSIAVDLRRIAEQLPIIARNVGA